LFFGMRSIPNENQPSKLVHQEMFFGMRSIPNENQPSKLVHQEMFFGMRSIPNENQPSKLVHQETMVQHSLPLWGHMSLVRPQHLKASLS